MLRFQCSNYLFIYNELVLNDEARVEQSQLWLYRFSPQAPEQGCRRRNLIVDTLGIGGGHTAQHTLMQQPLLFTTLCPQPRAGGWPSSLTGYRDFFCGMARIGAHATSINKRAPQRPRWPQLQRPRPVLLGGPFCLFCDSWRSCKVACLL